ncbi:hypothetical protein [Acrocarpospora sp. B8E8]|uniref:hypothetical protein n=1 Tax=Acrocarpospora sp. B8E8 TaxID=3153572 RepID=UPI00325FA03C
MTLHNLLRGRQSPSQRRELFVLAAQVSGLLSYMAVNMGRSVLADAYATEAAMLAGEADHVELQMWVLGTRSFGLYYQGHYDEADAAASAGAALDPSSPQAIRLLINGRARALARIQGRGGDAERMIVKRWRSPTGPKVYRSACPRVSPSIPTARPGRRRTRLPRSCPWANPRRSSTTLIR